jgi:hypothetical protein
MNTIMCLEPWGGEGISEKDTGLGNRITHWAILYYVSTFLEDCELLVQEEYWPELEFISLPKTKVRKISFDQVKEQFLPLSSLDVLHILNSKTNADANERILPFIQNSKYIGMYSEEYILSKTGVRDSLNSDGADRIKNILSSGIKDIKFKSEKINKFFKDRFSDFSAIHLRRGLGTNPSLSFIDWYLNYDKEILMTYLNDYYHNTGYSLTNGGDGYTIIPDTVYFSIIEDIISKNKNQKIYISSDIPENYYPYYFEKYSDNIVSRNQHIDEFLNLFEYDECEIKSYKYSLKQTLINLFDLFVLSYSKTLIIDGSSTWGTVASLIGEQKVEIDTIQYILGKEGISFNEFKRKYKFFPIKKRK